MTGNKGEEGATTSVDYSKAINGNGIAKLFRIIKSNFVLNTDSRLSDARTPTSHNHTKSDITDFPTIPTVPTDEISANTSARHTHSNKNILDAISGTPLYEHQSLKTINNQSIVGTGNITIQSGSGASTWDEISGKPSTFPPSSHEHTVSEISDFPSIPTSLSELTDDTTHRVVTDTEKSTWSGKQDAIPSERMGGWNTAYTHSQSAHAPSDAQKNVQSDWNATSGDALILNKPTIPTVPTDEISANTNARHTHSNKSILDGITSAPITEHQSLKTINGNSLVGTGNIEISGGGGVPTQWNLLGTTTGTTPITLNLTGYNEIMVVHRGKVSTSATVERWDSTILPVDELSSSVLEIAMGGTSATPAGLYGACFKITNTTMTPSWVYYGGSAVTTTQTWKVYARTNSMETDLASVLGGGF